MLLGALRCFRRELRRADHRVGGSGDHISDRLESELRVDSARGADVGVPYSDTEAFQQIRPFILKRDPSNAESDI